MSNTFCGLATEGLDRPAFSCTNAKENGCKTRHRACTVRSPSPGLCILILRGRKGLRAALWWLAGSFDRPAALPGCATSFSASSPPLITAPAPGPSSYSNKP